MTADAFIVGAKRTAIGNLSGAFASTPAHELGAAAIGAVLGTVDPSLVEQVILGQVLSAGQGMNPARQAARAAGLADDATALGINQVCGSGLRSVALAAQQIQLGEANVLIAGGQENMSLAPHAVQMRAGKKFGNAQLLDTMMSDGLTDAFFGYPMGVTAENVAKKYDFTRDAQDEFALHSQQKAAAAKASGKFESQIVPVTLSTRKGDLVIDEDEFIRAETTMESLGKLRPAFDKEGTVTAGNASGINDGAAAVLLMSEAQIKTQNIEPLARIVSVGHHGLAPEIMGLGPIGACQNALKKAGWSVDDVDLWEVNEAFAAQSMAVLQDIGMNREKVNVNGGAIALGHPIGASGARILVTLLHEMAMRNAKRGLASLCIGGGMGIALCVER